MKTENKILMQEARVVLSGKWGLALVATLISVVVSGALSFIPLVSVATSGPLYVGLMYFFLMLSRGQTPVIKDIFKGFDAFLRNLLAFILMVIFIALWVLLLIIPGIIAIYAYMLTFFILADDASISASGAITKIKKMMQGNKWKLFCLHFRFFGWAILCVLTFGIGFLWLLPYMHTSTAKFYDDVKANYSEALGTSGTPQSVVTAENPVVETIPPTKASTENTSTLGA
jgi:uncharacterized membrane protein